MIRRPGPSFAGQCGKTSRASGVVQKHAVESPYRVSDPHRPRSSACRPGREHLPGLWCYTEARSRVHAGQRPALLLIIGFSAGAGRIGRAPVLYKGTVANPRRTVESASGRGRWRWGRWRKLPAPVGVPLLGFWIPRSVSHDLGLRPGGLGLLGLDETLELTRADMPPNVLHAPRGCGTPVRRSAPGTLPQG
jgi:hypothetical protein